MANKAPARSYPQPAQAAPVPGALWPFYWRHILRAMPPEPVPTPKPYRWPNPLDLKVDDE